MQNKKSHHYLGRYESVPDSDMHAGARFSFLDAGGRLEHCPKGRVWKILGAWMMIHGAFASRQTLIGEGANINMDVVIVMSIISSKITYMLYHCGIQFHS